MTREMGIRGLQSAMGSSEVSARELVDRCLERIDAVDRRGPQLNSILELNPDAAAIAETLDAERAQNGPRSPLHGVPIVLKGNIDTADRMTTTAGSLALAGSIPPRDAFLVERLRVAGAVILGKANLSEWANFRGKNSLSGWSSQGGQTRNPYDTRRSPCGSSSGSAVAVAAGLCSVAIGTETDGSIVCPAQTCGIVGIKPTVGLVSRSGIVPIAHSQDTAGPMARTVEDAAILLNVLIGEDPRDSATGTVRDRRGVDYTRHLDPDGLRGARIGVARNFLGSHREVDRLMSSCLKALNDLGAILVDPANVETAGKWRDSELEVLLYEFKHDLGAYLASLGSDAPVKSLAEIIAFNEAHADEVMPHFGQELMEMAQAKGPLTEEAYVTALETNLRLARTDGIDATLRKHDLDAIVAPTGGPAWLIDTVHGDYGVSGCSSPAAVAGYPHVTVPAGYADGLPIGLSFFGGAWEEAKLIRFAFAFERMTKARRPPSLVE
jgi:amidase